MKANYFEDFENLALVESELKKMSRGIFFEKPAQIYENSYCCIGKDFIHSDHGILPVIKMESHGKQFIELTLHHIFSEFSGATEFSIFTENSVLIDDKFSNGEILELTLPLDFSEKTTVYFSVKNSAISYSMIRILLELHEGESVFKKNVDHWKVKNMNTEKLQEIQPIFYGEGYKY